MTDRERLTTDRRKIFARESLTIMSMNKDELRRHYNEIFDRLQEYEVAEEQGQLIRPPCKVGDVVWYLNKRPHIALFQNSVYKAKVVRLVTISTGTVIVIQIKSEGCCEIPDESDWGITLFASREEAEKALKGGGKE